MKMNLKVIVTVAAICALSICQTAIASKTIPYQPLGVTYNGLHATPTPDVNSVNADLTCIKNTQIPGLGTSFAAIRTYYPQFNGSVGIMNQVEATAPQLKVLLGLYLFECYGQPASWTANNLADYVIPFLTKPNLTGVLVGNEEGAPSVDIVIKYIDQIRSANASVAIGSAQTTGYWLSGSNAEKLASNCDFIAVNIYPAWNWQAPDANNQPDSMTPQQGFNSFVSQYQSVKQKYPGKQIIVTETGWPTTFGSVSSQPKQYQIGLTNAETYLQLVGQWAKQNDVVVYYYEMFDSQYGVNTSSPFNFHFGVLDTNRIPKHAS